MKVRIINSFIFLLIINFSCIKPENELIEVYHINFLTENYDGISDTLYLTKSLKIFDNGTFEVYSEPEVDSGFRFAIAPLPKTKKQIVFFDDTCELVSSKEFEARDQIIEIYKYYYDRDNSVDEESFIYYNPGIGLIAIYNLGWFSFDFFKQESTNGLIENFKSDTTGFILEK